MAMPRSRDGRSLTSLPSIVSSPCEIVLEPGDHPQQRRLAAAGGADEDHEVAVLDVEVDTLDGDELAVDLDEVAQGDRRHSAPP